MRLIIPCCFLLFSCNSLFSQKISGRILSEDGEPVSGVTVEFKNKSAFSITDGQGKFTIQAKNLPDTLLLSAVGYEPYQVRVTNETIKDSRFEIVLLQVRHKKELAEVVVVGYGYSTERKSAPSGFYGSRAGTGSTAEMYRARNNGTSVSGKKFFMLDSLPGKKDSLVYKAGMLTAGEVNDFNKWKMWQDFEKNEFKIYSDHWKLYPKQRYSVQLQNKDHVAIAGQPVFLINEMNDTVWTAVTDNTGKAELWAGMREEVGEENYHISSPGCNKITNPSGFANGMNRLEKNTSCSLSNTVDISFVVDATGSMGDEIEFLKIQLENVIRNTFAEHSDLDLHVSSVFYRDRGDEYLSRHIDFQKDLLKVLNFVKLQKAGGGGDMPEAVDAALQTALDSLHWSPEARSRLLFLVLDAPPHDEAKEKIFELIRKASAKGVRIIPVVCSGADKSTEFIMRSMALATNGTYVFLTDDSGIGLPHIKPTTDVFNVEFLNSLLERIITQMVFATKCGEQPQPENFKNTPPNIQKIKIYPNPTQGNITIESQNHLKEIFITDFTGKILMRIETNEKQTRWNINLGSYPNATYLVKYITIDDQWGAEKVVLIH